MTDATPVEQRLVVFTERDCALIVKSMCFYVPETDAERAHFDRIIERLS